MCDTYFLNEAKVYVEDARRMTGVDITTKLEFNDRLLATFGDANKSTNTIRISTKIWRTATQAQRREVVMHEYCHLADWVKYRGWGHGRGWRHLMRTCGLEPKVYHTITCPELQERRSRQVKFEASCGCRKHQISKQRYNKMLLGTMNYRCVYCKQRLQLPQTSNV